ncbi:MAG: chorismate-binding protein [Bacteroidota bacterium]
MDFEPFLLKAEDHLNRKLPFVLYSKPSDPLVKGIFQRDDQCHTPGDFNESGFVFAPFDSNQEAVVLRPDELLSTSFQSTESKRSNVSEPTQTDTQAHAHHLNLVTSGIARIEASELEKVVLSRRMEVLFDQSPLEFFQTLLNKYPTAFCYLWYHPHVGLWLGASPEILVSIREKQLETMSLAGTFPYKKDELPVWTAKEKQEQGFVTTYLLEVLKPFTTQLQITEEKAVRAGELWHLRSRITGMLNNNELGSVIRAIHPTPAVCGIPGEEASAFILKNEGYDREYYTGYLGELSLDGQPSCDLYVNLRCLQLVNGKALIYIGGGITSDSNPQREWEETVAKSNTMLNALFNS